MSSLGRGHVNLLCVIQFLVYVLLKCEFAFCFSKNYYSFPFQEIRPGGFVFPSSSSSTFSPFPPELLLSTGSVFRYPCPPSSVGEWLTSTPSHSILTVWCSNSLTLLLKNKELGILRRPLISHLLLGFIYFWMDFQFYSLTSGRSQTMDVHGWGSLHPL